MTISTILPSLIIQVIQIQIFRFFFLDPNSKPNGLAKQNPKAPKQGKEDLSRQDNHKEITKILHAFFIYAKIAWNTYDSRFSFRLRWDGDFKEKYNESWEDLANINTTYSRFTQQISKSERNRKKPPHWRKKVRIRTSFFESNVNPKTLATLIGRKGKKKERPRWRRPSSVEIAREGGEWANPSNFLPRENESESQGENANAEGKWELAWCALAVRFFLLRETKKKGGTVTAHVSGSVRRI